MAAWWMNSGETLPFFSDNLPYGLFHLGGRGVFRVPIPGYEKMAAFRAESAVNTGVHINLETSAGLIVQHLPDDPLNLFR